MKPLLSLILCLILVALIKAQDTITLDASTMTLSDAVSFKVGKNINFIINHLASTDSFSLEISSNDVFNQAGFQKFTDISSATKFIGTVLPFYFLSFKVEDKDYTILKLIRYKNNVKIEERTYSYRNSGGVKFDVSSGFFWTGLKDEVYALKYSSDTTRQIISENNSKGRVGIGLLAHLHSRYNCWVNWGGSIGFELNNDSKVSYLAGGSIFFGRDKKFIFNFGGAFSKVDVLSNLYKVNEVVPNEVSAIPLVKIWKCGLYVGASYNF